MPFFARTYKKLWEKSLISYTKATMVKDVQKSWSTLVMFTFLKYTGILLPRYVHYLIACVVYVILEVVTDGFLTGVSTVYGETEN